MNKNQRIIISELLKMKSSITSQDLSLKLGISSKTVLRCLNSLKEECINNGAIIFMKPGEGILLKITDHNLFNNFLENTCKLNDIPSTPEERLDYLLHLLLYSCDYIKTSDIAETLYISQSRLRTDIKDIKNILKKYNLQIVNKPNYGIKIEGTEKHRRACMAEFYRKRQQSNHHDNYNIMLNNVISKVLFEKNIKMSNVSLESLTINSLITVERIKSGNIISLSNDISSRVKDTIDYKVALSLCESIENIFGINIPNDEVCYLTQHLLGKKNLDFTPDLSNINVTTEVTIALNLILKNIFNETRIDFYNDAELKTNLLLHLVPFLERAHNNMMINNPIIDDIKNKYCFAYEIATIGLSAVCRKFNLSINEDEIGFFALHFILALERKNDVISPSNILIVCSTGRATSQLLAYQVQKKFGHKLNKIQIVEAHMLEHIDLDLYDFIFSTVPVKESLSNKVYRINTLLNDEDFNIIEDCIIKSRAKLNIKNILDNNLFFNNIDASSKEDALKIMIKKVRKYKDIPNTFYSSVIEREGFASTELDNLIAIPHPNQTLGKDSFIAIGILKKPIFWDKKTVQIIFLISSVNSDNQHLHDFYEGLIKIINNKKVIYNFLQNPNYNELVNILENC